ncbi:MAG: DUF3050 domain-containing protein [Deltaproteobacteria bacterium]|nr:DUF3050 domain-containing protein [Deltaproteobacteria bacterium]
MADASLSPHAQARVHAVVEQLTPVRRALVEHPLYAALVTADDLRVFMEHHVFAVWDFMSLLKALQSTCTCTTVPWVPRGDPSVRRFLHEIVLAEESDVDAHGAVASHFELYRRAMRSFAVDTGPIDAVVAAIADGVAVDDALLRASAPPASRAFVGETFALLRAGGPHTWAAAFTFGREDVIPAMFRRFVDELAGRAPGSLSDLVWYLDRHIGLDGDEHGPLALRMVAALCGDDDERWREATAAALRALRARLALWDGIVAALPSTTTRAATLPSTTRASASLAG